MVTRPYRVSAVGLSLAMCALVVPSAGEAAMQPSASAASTSSMPGVSTSAASSTVRNGRIAFSTGFILVNPETGGNSQVFTVNPDGSGQRQLTQVPAKFDAADPAWSPHGAKIAYVSNVSGHFAVWVMRADGSGQHPIAEAPATDFFTPQWSPTGKRLVVTRCDVRLGFASRCQIVVMRADGSATRTVVGGRRINQSPDYSPNGRWIAFESDRAGFHSAIWVVHPDGTGLTRLTRPALEAFWPRWSPHSRRLLFTNNCCRSHSNVFVVRADGSHVRQLTHFNSTHQGGFASFSPDGRRIVLANNMMRRANSQFNDLYTMRADGSQLRRIVADRPHVALSDWGPAR